MTHLGVDLRPLWDLVDRGEISYGIVQPGQEVTGGTPIVRVKDLSAGTIDASSPLRVDPEIIQKHRRTTLYGGEVLVSLVGTVGLAAIVPPELLGWNVARAIAVLRPNHVESRWLKYCFELPWVKHQLLEHLNTTVQATLNLKDLRDVLMPYPAESERRAIADVLGALDDKIAANGNALERAQSLCSALLEGALSEGANKVAVDQVATFLNRQRIPLSASQRDALPGDVPYYGATGVFGHVTDPIFDEVLVLVGEDGSVVNDDGTPVTQYIWGPSWINNHAHVLKGSGVSSEVLYLTLRRQDVRPLVTGAVQAKISMGKLKALSVNLPSPERITRLDKAIQPLFALRRTVTDESRTLGALRDTLLPALMSGKLRVRDAERQIEEVV